MEQYISKVAVVEEIKRRKKYYENLQTLKPVYESNIENFNELLSFLNTVEVKEVDIKSEIDNYLNTYFGYEKDKDLHPFLKKMASYFYLLGFMGAQKTTDNNIRGILRTETKV